MLKDKNDLSPIAKTPSFYIKQPPLSDTKSTWPNKCTKKGQDYFPSHISDLVWMRDIMQKSKRDIESGFLTSNWYLKHLLLLINKPSSPQWNQFTIPLCYAYKLQGRRRRGGGMLNRSLTSVTTWTQSRKGIQHVRRCISVHSLYIFLFWML